MILAACQTTGSTVIDVSAASGASFCAVVKSVDLRASRQDTKLTQRTLYQLQQARKSCQ
jgi:hypothetical protein